MLMPAATQVAPGWITKDLAIQPVLLLFSSQLNISPEATFLWVQPAASGQPAENSYECGPR